MTDVNADVGEAGVEERLHLLLDRFRQRLAAAPGLEREIRRQCECIARLRLDSGGRPRRPRQDRLGHLRAGRRRGLEGAGSRRCRQDRPGWLAGAERRLKSACRGSAGQDWSCRRNRASLERGPVLADGSGKPGPETVGAYWGARRGKNPGSRGTGRRHGVERSDRMKGS